MKIERVKEGYKATATLRDGTIIDFIGATIGEAVMWCLWKVKKHHNQPVALPVRMIKRDSYIRV